MEQQEPYQLELHFPVIYHLGIYESALRWSGQSVPVTILEESDNRMRVRLERDYASLAQAGMELQVCRTSFQETLEMTLQQAVADRNIWANSLWTLEGQFIGYGILGTKEKLTRRIG